MKILYEYKAVQVPEPAKKIIDDLFVTMKKENYRLRKADLWLRAVELFAETEEKKK